ncbi:dNA-binding helix-turn-helix protein [Mycoplasma sp. CAG:776]|nr:dNA-binding helix-turn-helix protein [Mycoplasma sp. CAG:776]
MLYQNKLTELRDEQKLTQKELAKLLNIDRSVYGRYEKEYQIMPIKHLLILCDYFKVSLDYLFNFTNQNLYVKQKETDKMILSKRLKDFRKENKITQKKLAQELNTSQSTIADYERGKNMIPTPFLYTICKKYNISADYLLGRINNPKYLK